MFYKKPLFFLLVCVLSLLATQALATRFVDLGAPGGDGTSWDSAYTNLTSGVLTAATDTDKKVYVAEGTYDMIAQIAVPAGVEIYGGYPATNTGTDLNGRDLTTHRTILNRLNTDAGNTHRHFTTNAAGIVFDGLELTGGLIDGNNTEFGASISALGVANPIIIRKCRFYNNRIINPTTNSRGGAINSGAPTTIENCEFFNNGIVGNAPNGGGAIFLINNIATSGVAFTISKCVFAGNYIVANSLGTNYPHGNGGAISAYRNINNAENSVKIENCIFAGNNSTRLGAAVFTHESTSSIANCLFYGNTCSTATYAQVQHSTNAVYGTNIVNSIFAQTAADNVAVASDGAGRLPTADTSLFDSSTNQGNATLVDPIVGDPKFLAATTGDWSAAAIVDANTARTTLTDTGAGFTPNALSGKVLQMDTNISTITAILTNTADTIVVSGNFAIASGANYKILDLKVDSSSPAVDKGKAEGAPSVDINETKRPQDIPSVGNELPASVFDIGPYELLGAPPAAGAGSSWLLFE